MAEAKAQDKPKKPKGGSKPRGRSLPGLRIDNKGLKPEQEAYCRARAMGMSIQDALISSQSGISKLTAYGWERKPEIINRISELAALASNNAILKNGLDRSWVISRLMSITERCMQAEPVMIRNQHGEMIESGEFTFDSTGATRALHLLGQEIGMFKPQEQKPGDEYANLSDDDLTRIAGELAAQVGLIEVGSGTQAQARQEQVIEVQAIRKAD